MHRSTAAALAGALVAVTLAPSWVPASAGPGSGDPHFVDVAPAAGLDFVCEHWGKWLGLGPRWFNDVFFCGSPSLGDFNGDGLTDVYFPNTRYSTKFYDQFLNDLYDPQDALFLNNGDGTFTEATAFVGIHDKGYSMASAAVDFDDDGDLDVYVANFREVPTGFSNIFSPGTVFYVNEGDGTFTRADPQALELVTELRCFPHPTLGTACVDDAQWGVAAAAADYDRDGDVDIYRGNYANYDNRRGMPPGLRATIPDSNNLYRNDVAVDGTFEDVADVAGASRYAGRTFAVNFADFDNDLWPDLYVANDENPNELYLNNRDGTFRDFSAQSTANDPRGAMCSEAADFNGDGNLDLFMSHFEDEHDGYYLGNGDGTFVNRDQLGALGIGYHYLSWACPALDYDNDGDLDLFVANGHMEPPGGNFIHEGDPEDDNGYELPNHLFRNTLRETGTHTWEDMRQRAGPGLLDRFVSSGAMAADFDLDGSLELLVVNNNQVPVNLYRNLQPTANHWLQVELRGTTSNSHGIGARVEVTAGSLTQMRQMLTGNTLGSGSAAPLHFGLGPHAGPATVKVSWPSGLVQTETVALDQPVRIVEGQGVQLDTLAPRVDVLVQGTLGNDGWYTSPVLEVSLAAVERGVGAQGQVASLRYRLDDGPVLDYTSPFQVEGEGHHKLTLLATDTHGNAAWYPREFRIDSVAPALALVEPREGELYVQDRPQGPSPTGSTLVVAPVQTPETTFDLVDDYVAGLRRSIFDLYGQQLPPPPATANGASAATVGSDGRTRVLAQAVEQGSGVRSATFALDGEVALVDLAAPWEWLADLRGLAAGQHTLTVTLEDRAGWRATEHVDVLVVPTTQDGALNTLLLGPSLPGRN